MIGIYYAIIAIIAVPVYVLSIIFKEKKNGVGVAICYAILFVIVLLFV